MLINNRSGGLTIAGTVDIGAPLLPQYSSVGNILAFFQANVPTSLLGWVDLTKLQSLHPDRITLNGSMVALKGPVLILQSIMVVKVGIIALSALAGALIAYTLSEAIYKVIISKKKDEETTSKNEETTSNLHTIATVAGGLLAGGAAYHLCSTKLPLEPGIYFY